MKTWRLRKIGEIHKATLDRNAPYIAGLLDGGGTFTIRWNKRARFPSFQPLIMVSMTNEEVIRLLAETLQVDYTRKERNGHRAYYVLRVTTKKELVMTLEALRRWLIVKREHAQIILELIALKERKDLPRKEIAYNMAKLYWRIRQLNTKGPRFDPDELWRDLEDSIENYFKSE